MRGAFFNIDMKDALTYQLDKGKIKTNKFQQFIGEKSTVVINTETGKIVTTWTTLPRKAIKLKERGDKK